MTYRPRRSTILQNFSPIAQTVYEICATIFFHFLAKGGLTPGPKFTKRGDDLAETEIYHPAKFHRSTPTHARDIRYQNSADKQKNKKTVTDISTSCLSACVDNNLHRQLRSIGAHPLYGHFELTRTKLGTGKMWLGLSPIKKWLNGTIYSVTLKHHFTTINLVHATILHAYPQRYTINCPTCWILHTEK